MNEERCTFCGQLLLTSQEWEYEWRHVGGREDRRETYCAAGYGHRKDEPRGNERIDSPSYRARRAVFLRGREVQRRA